MQRKKKGYMIKTKKRKGYRYEGKGCCLAIMLCLYSLLGCSQSQSSMLSVDKMFNLIEANNNRLKSQKTAVEMSKRAVDAAKADKWPDIQAQLSLSYLGNGFLTDRDFSNYTSAPIPHFGNNFSLQATQVLYSGGAVSNRINEAELAHKQAELTVELDRQQIKFYCLGYYLDLCKTNNQMKVYNNNIALTNKLVNDVKAKIEQGTALKNDLTRYELQLENLKLGLSRLASNRLIINHTLCNALGLEQTSLIIPDTTLIYKVYEQAGYDYWKSNTFASSPQIKQAAVNTAMKQTQEKMQRAGQLPTLSLIAANHFDGPITIEVPPINKNFNYWFVGVNVSYNLSSVYKNNKRVKQAEWAARQAKENETVVKEQADNAIQAGYADYLQAYVELQTQQKKVELAQQNYNLLQERYLQQLALITDMTDASNLKLAAELDEVNARIGIMYAYYKLKFLSGTL